MKRAYILFIRPGKHHNNQDETNWNHWRNQ